MKLFFLSLLFLVQVLQAQELKLVLPVGHTSLIKAARFSPDNKYVLTASSDKTVKIWEASSGKLLDELTGYTNDVSSLDFSSAGTQMITASDDGSVKFWDWRNRKLTRSWTLSGSLASAIYAPDNKTVLIRYALAADSAVELFNTDNGTLIPLPGGIGLNLTDALFSRDGRYIIAGYSDGTIRTWNLVTNRLGKENKNIKTGISHLALSPNGKYLAAALSDSTAVITELSTGKILKVLKGHQDMLHSVAFSPNGDIVASASEDNTARLWNTGTGKLLKVIETSDDAVHVSFSPDSKLLVIANNFEAGVWRVDDGALIAELKEHAKGLNSIQFSPDGKKILVSSNDYSAYSWNISGVHSIKRIKGHRYPIYDANFSSSGKYIATGSGDTTAKVWDAETGALIKTFKGHTDIVASTKLSSDESTLLTASMDKTAILWDIETGKKLHTFKGHDARLVTALFSHDGKYIVTASENYVISNHIDIIIWNAADGKMIRGIKSNVGWGGIETIFLTPDGKTIIAVYHNKNIIFYRFDTGEAYHTLNAGDFTNAGFSPDGKDIYLSLGDYTVAIYDLQTGNLKLQLKGHENVVTGLDYSPDKRLIATIADDNTTRVWEAASGKLIYTAVMLQDDYFVQLPSKHYISSPNAAKLLHYVTPDLKAITFEQLDVKYNRPDLVLQAAGSRDTLLIQSYQKAYGKRIKKLGIDTSGLGDNVGLPETEIIGRENIVFEQKKQQLTLRIKGSDETYPLNSFNLWVNEVPLFGLKGIPLNSRRVHRFDTTLTIILSQGSNVIETSVTNVNGTESYRMPLTISYTPAKPLKETLYFIGIGIDRFQEEGHNLNYSVKDVRDLALNLKKQYGSNIVIDTLFNEAVNVSNISALKNKLLASRIDDKVIISYSGHGLLSKDFDYYLSTYAVNFSAPEQGGLPYEELESLLDSIPARKKLMLIDACHSGELDKEEMQQYKLVLDQKAGEGLKGLGVENTDSTQRVGMKNSFELMQELFVNVGRSTGATIISAAAGTQLAQERGDLKNGVFTYAILEYMQKHPSATVSELKQYVNKRVPELTNGLQVPTTRTETKQVDWQLW